MALDDTLSYSQLKPAWHLDRIAALRAGVAPAPVHVQMVLSDLCNQSCDFCAYRLPTGLSNELFAEGDVINPNRKIPTARALELVDECAELGVKAIQFTGGGEPTVHPDHLQIFARAQAHGISTALVTNGVKLNSAHPAITAMTWIRVSVDAGHRDTYARVRRVGPQHWDTAWRNIERLVASCNQITVSIGFVVTPENYTEVGEAARLARAAGVRNLRVGAVFTSEGTGFYPKDLLPLIRTEIRLAKVEHDGDGFQVVDLFDRRIGDLVDGGPEDAFCGYQYLTAYIGGDLGLYRCCNTAYTRRGKVADLSITNLKQHYSLGATKIPLRQFDARGCKFCQFNGQNKLLAQLTREPEHAEFV